MGAAENPEEQQFRAMFVDSGSRASLLHALKTRAARGRASPELLSHSALGFAQADDLHAAHWCIGALVDRGQASIDDLFLLGSIKLTELDISGRGGDHRSFLLPFRTIVGHDPNHAAAWMAIGRYWLDTADITATELEEAGRAFQAVTELEPLESEGHYGLGMVLQAQGKLREAAQAYLQAMQLRPNDHGPLLRLSTSVLHDQLTANERELVHQARAEPRHEPARVEVTRGQRSGHWRLGAMSCIDRQGMVILRHNAIEAESVREFARAHRDRIHAALAPKSATMSRIREAFPELEAPLESLVDRSVVRSLADDYLQRCHPGWALRRHLARHIQFHGYGPVAGTPLHQDHPSHAQAFAQLTLWIPFTHCSPEGPNSLDVCLERTRQPVRTSTDYPGAVNAFDVHELEQLLAKRFQTLTLAPGDALLFDAKVLHRTARPPCAPAGERMSCDVRYMCGPQAWGLVY